MKARPSCFAGRTRFLLIAGLASTIATTAVTAPQTAETVMRAKNVILMIADGTGTNTIAATGMYTGKLGKQIFDGATWTKSYVSTYPLRTGETPIAGSAGLAQDPATVYDPAKNWDTVRVRVHDWRQSRPLRRLCLDQAHRAGLRQHDRFCRHGPQDLQQRREC